MTQARSLQSATPARDPHRQRTRNLQTGLVLVATFALLLIGSVVFAILHAGAQ